MNVISRLSIYLRRLVLWIFILIIFISIYIYYPVILSPENDYLDRKGTIRTVIKTKQWQNKASQYEELSLRSDSGLKVELLVRQPINKSGKLPVALLLGGVNTGHNACKLIPDLHNIICASLSYPGFTSGKYKEVEFFYRIHEVQQIIKDTPSALLLALDYLAAQPYIDQKHVELVGVSLGAFFVSVPASLDQRISRVWLVQGAAEPGEVIKHNFLKRINSDVLAMVFSKLTAYAIGSQHILPEEWVPRIAPRQVIIINAKNDEALPAASVKILHDAAKQPKEIIWTHGDHVTPGRKEIIQQLSDIVIKRIATTNKR